VTCYRPISNLSVLSKLLERLIARQLVDYLTATKLLPNVQSAYRAFHSTTTTVLKVLAHILSSLGTDNVAVLTLLDLSAAFDMVDHATLLRRPETSYGIGGSVLDWFASYLSDRVQTVRCGTSSPTPQQSCAEYRRDQSLDQSFSCFIRRIFCSSSSVRICVHTCKPTTRRLQFL